MPGEGGNTVLRLNLRVSYGNEDIECQLYFAVLVQRIEKENMNAQTKLALENAREETVASATSTTERPSEKSRVLMQVAKENGDLEKLRFISEWVKHQLHFLIQQDGDGLRKGQYSWDVGSYFPFGYLHSRERQKTTHHPHTTTGRLRLIHIVAHQISTFVGQLQ